MLNGEQKAGCLCVWWTLSLHGMVDLRFFSFCLSPEDWERVTALAARA